MPVSPYRSTGGDQLPLRLRGHMDGPASRVSRTPLTSGSQPTPGITAGLAGGSAPSTPRQSAPKRARIAADGFAAMEDRRFADRRRTAIAANDDEVPEAASVLRRAEHRRGKPKGSKGSGALPLPAAVFNTAWAGLSALSRVRHARCRQVPRPSVMRVQPLPATRAAHPSWRQPWKLVHYARVVRSRDSRRQESKRCKNVYFVVHVIFAGRDPQAERNGGPVSVGSLRQAGRVDHDRLIGFGFARSPYR